MANPDATLQRPPRADAPPRPPGTGGLSLHEKIDVCRGLFAGLVVMAHALEIAWGVHPGAREALPAWLGHLVFGVFGTGTYYVMGFFVISGYCIHLSVARSLEAGGFSGWDYTLARLSRILPLYYVGLLTTLAAEWAIAGHRPHEWPNGLDAATFLAQVFMVQNLTETFGSFASSWSITNEVFYYAMYGVLAARLAGGRRGRPAWVGLAVCVAVAAVTQALYVTVGRNPYVYSFGMLLGLGMLWFAGALVAVHGEEWVKDPVARFAARLWPVVLAAAVAWKTAHMPPHGLYLISGLAFALMMLDFIARSPAKPPANVGRWRSRLVTTSGLASYPLYLFHGPLLMVVGSWVMRTGVVADWRLTWALLVAVGLASGVALGWVLERPVMAWRAAFLRRRRDDVARPGGRPGRPSAAVRPERVCAGAQS